MAAYVGTCRKDSDIVLCVPQGQEVNIVVVIMAIYSYIPIAVFLVLIGWYIWKRSIVPLIVLVTLLLSLLLNEVILKNIIKQKRPIESCACSMGMPSGHSLVSALLLFWIVYEFTYSPLDKNMTKRKRMMYVALAIAAFALVPYSRVYLKYHTWQQVVVGASVGIGISILIFAFLRRFLIHRLPKKEIRLKGKIVLINHYCVKHRVDSTILLGSVTSSEDSVTQKVYLEIDEQQPQVGSDGRPYEIRKILELDGRQSTLSSSTVSSPSSSPSQPLRQPNHPNHNYNNDYNNNYNDRQEEDVYIYQKNNDQHSEDV